MLANVQVTITVDAGGNIGIEAKGNCDKCQLIGLLEMCKTGLAVPGQAQPKPGVLEVRNGMPGFARG